MARSKGAFVYGICNVVGASIPRNTDSGTYIHVGPEIGVASTKAFTGQVTVLTLLALCVGQMRGTVDEATVERIAQELKNMPIYIKEVLRLLVALCIDVVMVMLIAHWWGVTAAVIFVAIESVLVLWMVTKSGVHVKKQRNDMSACQNNVDKTVKWKINILF